MVEWKKIGDVCELERGVRVIKKDLQQEGLIPVYQNSLTPLGYFDKSNYPANTPFVICAGAAGEIGFCNKPFWAADDCTCILCSSSANKKYIYYCLLVNQHTLKSQVRKASVPRLSKDVIGKLIIPIPSLSEQQRIVNILDTFTSSIDNLKEQIAQRRKQYEYYRDQLLDLEGKEGVEMKTLGELSYKISSGRNKNKEDQGLYPVFGSTGIIAYTNSYLFDKQLILVARVGANAGYVYMINEKCDVTDNTLIIETKEDNNRKFIYYYLVYMNINQFAKGGGQPLITGGLLKEISIPLPSLQDQQRIVSILDTFEASIQNLEAQLSQREKQYEYYRNKLLAFE